MALIFDGAVVPIRGIEILLVVVRPWVLADPYETELILLGFEHRFERPVVLLAHDAAGTPVLRSRGRWARLVGCMPASAIPWRRFTVPTAS